MALTLWTKSSGYLLGSLNEREATDIALPVDTQVTGVTYTVISGALPPGLRIVGNHIVGTSFDVARESVFSFCIRASRTVGNATEFADRTFKINVSGADAPEFVTQAGYLDIGTNNQLYTIDSTYVDYQLEAFDADLATGQRLSYFIADNDGRLPPGLTLTTDGRIVGFVQPSISVTPADGDGTYDNSFFDSVAFDFAYRPSNGFDSYVYDQQFFDYSLPSVRPRKLNQNYEFIVTLTDGDSIAKRKFAIFVVGDDYFRADNTNWLDGSSQFTADVTYLKAPIWSTPANLGTYRANNYVTVMLDTYDTEGIVYELKAATELWTQNTNYVYGDIVLDALENGNSLVCIEAHNSNNEIDITKWANYGIPPGTSFDQASGEVFGAIPYQPAISKVYRFIVDAVRYSGDTDVSEFIATPANEGFNLSQIIINTSEFPDVALALNNVSNIRVTTTEIDPSQQAFEYGNDLIVTGVDNVSDVFVLANSSIDGETLTVGTTTGTITPGAVLSGAGVLSGTYIVGNISGTGAGSTWSVSQAQSVEDVTIVGYYVVELTFEETTAPTVGNYYRITGNSNPLFNGFFPCTASTTTSITLSFATDPGVFGTGTTLLAMITPSIDTPSSVSVVETTIDPSLITSIDYSDPAIVVINLAEPLSVLTTNSTVVNIRFITPSGEVARTSRLFYMNLIGEIDSVIDWVSDSDLGSLTANFVSTIKLEATSTVSDAVLLYTLTGGSLPPGLSLALDGEVVGKVRQFGDGVNLGITLVDGLEFTLDGGKTKFDKVFTFTVKARDQYGFSASEKTFTIKVDTPDQLTYSNIKTRPFLKLTQRESWKEFINNTSVFTPESIYRPNDPSFGLQTELAMLVYAGIETRDAAAYISAMGLNHKRKRFHFGDIKKAVAYLPGTYTAVYEVVYVQMVDPLEPNGKRLPSVITSKSLQPNPITTDLSNNIWASGWTGSNPSQQAVLERGGLDAYRPDNNVTVDSTGYEVSNPKINEYYPSSISNWRDNIKNWQDNDSGLATERNYLPLWMRSIQPGSNQELDFQLAVPLCYCKIGKADDIILNIKYSGFDFKALDYTADRYIIDSVEGLTSDKYLVFRNDRITV